jgi:hypothetical protein
MQPINIASFFFAQPPARKGSESGPAEQHEDFPVPHNGEKIAAENKGSQCEIAPAVSVGPPKKPLKMQKKPKKTLKMQTQVHGCYRKHLLSWIIPDEIDLDDKETYDFGDVWGILYIFNKKTGETIEIADSFELKPHLKRCQKLELFRTGIYQCEVPPAVSVGPLNAYSTDFGTSSKPLCGICGKDVPDGGCWVEEDESSEDVICDECNLAWEFDDDHHYEPKK